MKTIAAFEHAILTQSDFAIPSDFDWLIEQNFDVFQIQRKNGQWQLKIRHYIGVIGLPSGYQLEILPKISQFDKNDICQTRQWLQQMLTDIWQTLTPKLLPNLANQNPINHQLPLNEWLAHTFWQGFQRYQPNQQYQRFEQNQTYLQGKLLVKEQLTRNHHQPHKFFHQSENFAVDTACNRLVKTTIEQIIGRNRLLDYDWQGVQTVSPNLYQATFAQAERELQALPTIIKQQNFAFISFCYSLLILGQASGKGQNQSQALLINMQFAFEKWVTFKLKQQFIGENVQVFEQFSQALTLDSALKIKPDMLIKSDNFIQVIDIKWKNIQSVSDIHLADMYQLMAYASEFNANEAWLVVPTLDKNLPKREIMLANPKFTKFFLVPFYLPE